MSRSGGPIGRIGSIAQLLLRGHLRLAARRLGGLRTLAGEALLFLALLAPAALRRANLGDHEVAPHLHGAEPHREVGDDAPQQRTQRGVRERRAAVPRLVAGEREACEAGPGLELADACTC